MLLKSYPNLLREMRDPTGMSRLAFIPRLVAEQVVWDSLVF